MVSCKVETKVFAKKFSSRDGFREKFPFLRKFSTSVSDLDTHSGGS
jgi:hypothetical protein